MATKVSKVYARHGESGAWTTIDKLYNAGTLIFQESPTSSKYNYADITMTIAPTVISGQYYFNNNSSETIVVEWNNGVETELTPGQVIVIPLGLNPVYARKPGYPHAAVTGGGVNVFYATIPVSTEYIYTRNLYVN